MNVLKVLSLRHGENFQKRLSELEAEVSSLRQLANALRAMVEIREDGSGSWKIPERSNER